MIKYDMIPNNLKSLDIFNNTLLEFGKQWNVFTVLLFKSKNNCVIFLIINSFK